MMKGMGQVQAKAKEVSAEIQKEFTKAQAGIAEENKNTVKSQIDSLKSYEKAMETLGKKILNSSTSTIELFKIEDPVKKLEVAKAVTIEKIDQMAAEIKARAEAAGEKLPVNFDVNIQFLKEEAIKEFDDQIKNFDTQTKKLDSKWKGFLKGFGDKAKPVFSKVGSLLIGTLKATGLITAGATAAAIFTGVAKKAIEAFSKTADGAKKLKGVQEQFAKLKAVGQDFANKVISAFLPLLEKVFPYIVKGAVLVAAHFRGMQAAAIALGTNVVSAFKRIGNGIEIIALKTKNFLGLGDEESKQRVIDLQAENEKLKNGIINVGSAYKEAFIAQYESGTKIAANTKHVTQLTDKQREAIQRLRDEYKKLIEEFRDENDQAALELIKVQDNPLAEFEVKKAIALDQLDKHQEEMKKRFDETNKELAKNGIKPILSTPEFESGLEAQRKSLEAKLEYERRELVDKLLKDQEDIAKKISDANRDIANKTANAKIDLIANPFDKLDAIKQQQIEEINQIRANAIEAAKAEGIPVAEGLEEYIQTLISGVENEYIQGLKDLNKRLEDEANKLANETIQINIDLIKNPYDKLAAIKSQKIKEVISFRESEIAKAKAEGLKVWEGLEDWVAAQLKAIEGQYIEGVDALDEAKRKRNPIAALLGFEDDEEFNEIVKQVGQAYHSINEIISAGIETQIQDNDRLIESIRGRLSAAEEALRREEELQRQGSANNVATKKREVDALKAQEFRALQEKAELQKRLARQQLIADSLQQASSLATAVADIFKANAKFPIIGIITAVASIASMLALFARFKSQVRAATAETTRAHKGGPVSEYVTGWVNPETGRTDRFGGRGHRIEDSSLVVGGKEFIINEETAVRQAAFLEDLNSGKYDGINIKQLVQSRMRLNDLLEERPVRYDSMKTVKDLRRLEKKVEKRRTSDLVTKKELQKMFEDQSKSIRKAILEERPEYIPITENTTGYLKKTPFLSERILLEKPEKTKIPNLNNHG